MQHVRHHCAAACLHRRGSVDSGDRQAGGAPNGLIVRRGISAERPATHEDFHEVPEHLVAEIIDGIWGPARVRLLSVEATKPTASTV